MAEQRARRPRRGRSAVSTPLDAESAMEVAARFLGTRPRTRWELERRLRRAGADDGLIATTLDGLARLGYVDDIGFVRWWAEQRDRHAPRGRRLVEAELRQRGVPSALLATLRDEPLSTPLPGEPLPSSEQERAAIALQRHLRGRPLPSDPRALQRLGAFLVRRGFDPGTVREALRAAATTDVAELADEDMP